MRRVDRALSLLVQPTAAEPRTRARRDALLLGVLFGFSAMGTSATAVALPRLAADLGVSPGDAAWTISLYALALGVATALHGRLSDLLGVRLPMLVGAGMMAAGALIAAAAPTYPVLLAGRLLGGAGAAALPTLGVTVLSRRYTGNVRSGAMALLAGASAAITGLGPLLGGLVTEGVGWRAVLALPVVGLLALPFLWTSLDLPGSHADIDLTGAALVTGVATGLVLLVQSPSTGAGVAATGAALLLVGVPALVRWVRRVPDGFLPRAVISNATVVRSALVASSIPACWFAILLAVPLRLEAAGYPSWQIGLVITPGVLAALVMPRISGPLLERLGPAHSLLLAGAMSMVATLLAALGLAVVSPLALGASVVLLTVSFGIGQPAVNLAVGDATEERVRGVALGVTALVFLVGGSVGSALVGGLSEVATPATSLLLLSLLPVPAMTLLVRHVRSTRAAAG